MRVVRETRFYDSETDRLVLVLEQDGGDIDLRIPDGRTSITADEAGRVRTALHYLQERARAAQTGRKRES